MRDPRFLLIAAAVWLLALISASATAQTPAQTPPSVPAGPLSLEQVLALAEPRSEAVAIAQAGVSRADGEQVRARSGLLPQMSIWIWFTVVVGCLFGIGAAALARRRALATA